MTNSNNKLLREANRERPLHEAFSEAFNSKDPDELSELAKDKSSIIKITVSQNENTSKETLKLLSADTDPEVRRGVAWNKNCPHDVLVKLAKDDYLMVRVVVPNSPACPAWLKLMLA